MVNESHSLNCFNSCKSYGKTVCTGIMKRLADMNKILGESPFADGGRADILRGIASGYIGVNAAGPYMKINPLAAHIRMSKRYNNGEFDWPRDEFINYCDILIDEELEDIPKFIADNLLALSQTVARYYSTGTVDDYSLDALDDAYLAMMVAKRYFMVTDDELGAAENEIFAETTTHLTFEE